MLNAKSTAGKLLLARKMSAGSLTKQHQTRKQSKGIFQQSGNASVKDFAEYYKDVIQDDTYNINNLDSLNHDYDNSADEYRSTPVDMAKRLDSRTPSNNVVPANFTDSYEN